VTQLFEDELVLVVGPRHKLAGRRSVEVGEIKRERFILFEHGASIRRASDAFFKRIELRPETALESNDTYFVKLMVAHGLGLSLMPAWAVREEVETGRLTCLRIEGHELTRSVACVALARFQSAPTRAFIAYILARRDELQRMARPE
jgi:DNA-binding transcriptional LysR family regulator